MESKSPSFPRELAELIVDYAQAFQLRDWIPAEKIDSNSIWANPKAFTSGWLDLDYLFSRGTKRELEHFARNPAAENVIMKHLDIFSDLPELWANSSMFEYLWARYIADDTKNKPNYTLMSANTHPKAIHILTHNGVNYGFNSLVSNTLLAMNPTASEYITRTYRLLLTNSVHANPDPEILTNYTRKHVSGRGMSSYISWNSHEWAVEYTRTHPELIDWYGLSMNPSIFVDARGVTIDILCGK